MCFNARINSNTRHTRPAELEMDCPYDGRLAATGKDFPLPLTDMDYYPLRIFPTAAHRKTI